MTREGEGVRLVQSMIPSFLDFDVKDSSFFGKWNRLPPPKEVQARAKTQHLAGVNPDRRKVYSMSAPYVRLSPVLFKEMGLFVKWGSTVQISEAQCLYAVRRFLKGDVPVPEVYGWRTDRNEKYIYMEYVKGKTLEQVWGIMGHDDKTSICHELRTVHRRLRQFEQDPEGTYIGENIPHILQKTVCCYLIFSS